jgi:hypothetical protein
MRVTELTIKKKDYYSETSTELTGSVVLQGADGKQEVRLTPETMSGIFKVIRAQVSATAQANARSVEGAIRDAEYAPSLEAAASVGALK